MTVSREELFRAVGERAGIQKGARIFYDKIYAHPWLKLYFASVPQEHIENQQTSFMSGALGGPNHFCGRLPVAAHEHMFITDESFEVRNLLLRESLEEAGVAEEAADAWMKLDNAFRSSIVKTTVSDCKKRYNTDTILDFPNPMKKAS